VEFQMGERLKVSTHILCGTQRWACTAQLLGGEGPRNKGSYLFTFSSLLFQTFFYPTHIVFWQHELVQAHAQRW
jgi:hypothetical protein